jgi:hypothetical protein
MTTVATPLIPAALEIEQLPPTVTVPDMRRIVSRLQRHLDHLEAAINAAPVLGEMAFTRRHGSPAADLRGGLALMRQGLLAADLAADVELLNRRKTFGAASRVVGEMRRKAAAAGLKTLEA